ncbi:MAG: hypothetical protein H6641_14975 [Caldilineaceae bacterium]|nr:hypothetical protein [Caldilineaceae bacterium]
MPNSTRGILLFILLLATALRWIPLDLVPYSYDEAHITGMAQGVATMRGELPLLSGGTTLGIQRSALDVYLLALPLIVSGGRAEGAVWGVGALGILAVALTYALGRHIGGRRRGELVGLLAALYMAANPWLVFYDRKLWAHIQVLFSVMLLWLAWRAIVPAAKESPPNGRARAAFWFPIVAALQLLSHVLGLVQILSWLAALLIATRRWPWRALLQGTAVALLLLLPYGWAMWQHMPSAATSGEQMGGQLSLPMVSWQKLTDPAEWLLARQLVTGGGISSIVGRMETESLWWRLNRTLISPLLLLLVGLGIVGQLYQCVRRKNAHHLNARLLLAWGLGPLLLLGLQPTKLYLQYWTVLLPLPALFFALGGTMLADLPVRRRQIKWARAGMGLVAVLITLVWIGSYVDVQAIVARGESGVTLRSWQQALATARVQAAADQTQEVRVAVHGVDPGYESEPAVVATLLGSPPFARFVAPSSPPALLFSYDQPSLYFWTIDAPATESQLQQWGQLMATQPLADRGAARLYRIPPFAKLSFDYTQLNPAPIFDAGMALLGYHFPPNATADQPQQITLVWRVLEPPGEIRQRDFTAFNHILNEQGDMAGQVDGLATLSRDWWPGDVLIQPYAVTLAAGNYTWRVGLYSRVDGGRAAVLDDGDAVDLPGLIIKSQGPED